MDNTDFSPNSKHHLDNALNAAGISDIEFGVAQRIYDIILEIHPLYRTPVIWGSDVHKILQQRDGLRRLRRGEQ